MSRKSALLSDLSLQGLALAPPQVCGSIRLIPVLRHQIRNDLRLFRRNYRDDLTIVDVAEKQKGAAMGYMSYIPHGLVLSWSDDGSPVVAQGGQLLKNSEQGYHHEPKGVQLLHRMVKREAANQLRLLPLHLAMEGFLSLYFSGPEIAWPEYSRSLRSKGLGQRHETAYSGRAIAGLEAALRVFEIHENQVGVLIYVAEALASAFVVPTPDDYRDLHLTLLSDFYGELIYHYGQLYDATVPMAPVVANISVQSLADLHLVIAKMRSDWAEFGQLMTAGLLRGLNSHRVYTLGSFSLQRFITQLDLRSENHMGEVILRQNGDVEYLKTYRLSGAQTRRAYLLSQLALHNWQLEKTAQALNQSLEDLVLRLEKAGFGYMLNNMVREQARAKRRRG